MNLKLLKTLSTINNGIVMKAGKELQTISPAKNILAIHHTPSQYDFAIYDLSQFLSVLSITSENREINIKDRVMEIKDGKTKLKFYGSSPDVIATPPDDVSVLTDADYTNTFTMTQEEYKTLMTAASVMNAKYLVFTSDGEKLTIRTESDYDDANSYETEFVVENGEALSAKLDRSTVKAPTDGAYTISIGNRAIRFCSEDTDYYIVRADD
jgi:hypothetical protein